MNRLVRVISFGVLCLSVVGCSVSEEQLCINMCTTTDGSGYPGLINADCYEQCMEKKDGGNDTQPVIDSAQQSLECQNDMLTNQSKEPRAAL